MGFDGAGKARDLSIALQLIIAIPMLWTSSMGQGRKEFGKRLSEMSHLARHRQFAHLFGFFMSTCCYHTSQPPAGKEQQMGPGVVGCPQLYGE